MMDMIAEIEALKERVGNLETAALPTKYPMDANQMLTEVRAYGYSRVDPVVGKDCPHTVFMPETGHVLSVARPDLGEGFVGYVMRTADQTTGGDGMRVLNTVGALFLGSASLFAPGVYNPDGSNWPRAADRFANLKAYMTLAELAQDAQAKEQWAKWDTVVLERVERERASVSPQIDIPFERPGTAGPPVDFSPQAPTALPPGETPL